MAYQANHDSLRTDDLVNALQPVAECLRGQDAVRFALELSPAPRRPVIADHNEQTLSRAHTEVHLWRKRMSRNNRLDAEKITAIRYLEEVAGRRALHQLQ